MKSIVFSFLHFLSGFITSISVFISPVLPVLGFLGFVLYEIWESIRLGDTGYLELREYMAGFYVGVLVCLALYLRLPFFIP